MESCVLNAVKTYVHVLATIEEHTYVGYCGYNYYSLSTSFQGDTGAICICIRVIVDIFTCPLNCIL